eukprot:TRINITY_DN3118_c0_g2_i8.p1 TRINITY_DN3118_c0_g2~~TRINITY_DN3118_c0_g2_i8.p1  ORF type:complete len:508 (+),score=207.71 TRINITY_DN3118_c0_g2_i8:94-1617(+)
MMKAIFCRSFLMVAPLTALRRAMQAEINFASSLVSLADQDNDGKVSHAELAAVLGKLGDVDHVAAASFLDNNFGDMDADADGLLGHDEVLNLVLAFRGQQKAAAIIQDADTGGDGKASMLELMDFGQKAGAGSAAESTGFEKVVKGSFAKMDADGDGNLDAKEMSNLLEIVHGQAASHVLELADSSGDGKASLAELSALASQVEGAADGELAAFLHEQFAAMDADSDGKLDQSEISGLLQALEASKGPDDAEDDDADDAVPNDVDENDEPSDDEEDQPADEEEDKDSADPQNDENAEPSDDEEDQPADEEEDEDSADPQDDENAEPSDDEEDQPADEEEDKDSADPQNDENAEPSDDEEDQPADEEEDKDSADPQNDENAEPSDDEEDQPADEEEDEDSADPQDDENAEPSDDEEDQPADEEEDKDSDAADNAAEASIFDRVIKEAEQKAGRMEDPEQILTEAENDAGLKDLAKKMGFDSTRIIEALRQNYEHIVHDEEKKSHIKVN